MVLAEELGLKVEKRPIQIDEIFNLKEAGCCGTAAVITPIKSITYKDKTIEYCKNDEIWSKCGECCEDRIPKNG